MAHTVRQRRRGYRKRMIITWLKLFLHAEVAVGSGPNERVSLGHIRMSRKLRRYIGVHAEPSCHPVTDSSFVAGESSPAFSKQEDPAAWCTAVDGPSRHDSEPVQLWRYIPGPLLWGTIVLPCQQDWRHFLFHPLYSRGGAAEANHPMLPEAPHLELVIQAVQRFPLCIERGVMISND